MASKRPKKPSGPKGWVVATKRARCKQTWMPDRVYVRLNGFGGVTGWGGFDVEGWSTERPRAYALMRLREHAHAIMRQWRELHSAAWTLTATEDAEDETP